MLTSFYWNPAEIMFPTTWLCKQPFSSQFPPAPRTWSISCFHYVALHRNLLEIKPRRPWSWTCLVWRMPRSEEYNNIIWTIKSYFWSSKLTFSKPVVSSSCVAQLWATGYELLGSISLALDFSDHRVYFLSCKIDVPNAFSASRAAESAFLLRLDSEFFRFHT